VIAKAIRLVARDVRAHQTDQDSARRPSQTITKVKATANRMRACRAPLRLLVA
jgi:hypothetical protein